MFIYLLLKHNGCRLVVQWKLCNTVYSTGNSCQFVCVIEKLLLKMMRCKTLFLIQEIFVEIRDEVHMVVR